MLNQIIEDKELGRLVIRVNSRARRLIFRTKSDAIYITVPPGTKAKDIEDAISSLKEKLLENQQRLPERKIIDLDYQIDTPHFKLSLINGQQKRFLADYKSGEMRIICPPDTDFRDEDLQVWLRKVIEEALRRNAKSVLPARLHLLSKEYGFTYNNIRINSSKGRWGSCSIRKDINLSYYLLLLPQHLIDYVLLHELCHTREMSHNEHFWNLLHSVTNNKALELRNELKAYNTEI